MRRQIIKAILNYVSLSHIQTNKSLPVDLSPGLATILTYKARSMFRAYS